ncbi:MAG: hypothetical protein OEM27_07055 [Nitrospinota bacterium]|nr:hypothetical protein [Nitrospinota bacterium]
MYWLKGKKTYIVAGLMVLTSLVHLLSGDMGFAELVTSEHFNTLLQGLGLGTLRAGVSKKSRF